MDELNSIEHANHAHRLIEAVGGLPRAARICGTGTTVLSNYQNPNRPETMPARIISVLQIAARTTSYSDAMTGEVEGIDVAIADPIRHSCDMMREAAEALGAIQTAVAKGIVTAADFAVCDRELADLEEQIAIVRASLRGAHLRVAK